MISFQDVLEQGAICGLTTVDEAILNFEMHAIQLIPNDEIPLTTAAIYLAYETYLALGGKRELPQDMIDAANAEIDGYFARQG